MKAIIHARHGVSLSDALRYAAYIIDAGNVSGHGEKAQPCYVTVIGGAQVVCERRNSGTLTFHATPDGYAARITPGGRDA